MPSVTVLMQPGAADWEFAPVLAVLREYFGYTTCIATPDARPITTLGGLRVEADRMFDTADIDGADSVIVIGSEAWKEGVDANLQNRLRDRIAAGKPTAAICAGTLALARSGALDDRAHTSNAQEFLEVNAEGYAGEARYRDVAHAVVDGKLVTAPGSAPASFASAVVSTLHPDKVGEVMGYWSMAKGEFDALGGDLAPMFEGGQPR